MSGHDKKRETRVYILCATLLCEMGKVKDPRLAGVVKLPLILRALTYREALKVLDEYGVKATG